MNGGRNRSYRIVKYKEGGGNCYYGLHSVFSHKDGSIWGRGTAPTFFIGMEPHNVVAELTKALEAAKEFSVLDESEKLVDRYEEDGG